MADQKPAQKTCFVIGPIGGDGTPTRTHADWLYEGIVLPTFRAHFADWKVTRSDKISSPGMIDSQIINLLIQADLVIADMSLLNANAFYEMGIRHMAQKPIIHMFVSGSEIPFDVKPYRAISFSFSDYRNLESAQVDLKAAALEAMSANHEVENPVTRALGRAEFSRTASEPEKILEGEVQSLSLRVMELESALENAYKRPNDRNKIVSFNPSITQKASQSRAILTVHLQIPDLELRTVTEIAKEIFKKYLQTTFTVRDMMIENDKAQFRLTSDFSFSDERVFNLIEDISVSQGS